MKKSTKSRLWILALFVVCIAALFFEPLNVILDFLFYGIIAYYTVKFIYCLIEEEHVLSAAVARFFDFKYMYYVSFTYSTDALEISGNTRLPLKSPNLWRDMEEIEHTLEKVVRNSKEFKKVMKERPGNENGTFCFNPECFLGPVSN